MGLFLEGLLMGAWFFGCLVLSRFVFVKCGSFGEQKFWDRPSS